MIDAFGQGYRVEVRQDNDGDFPGEGLFQMIDEFDAVELGHEDVEDDQVNVFFRGQGQSGFSVWCREGGKAGGGKLFT